MRRQTPRASLSGLQGLEVVVELLHIEPDTATRPAEPDRAKLRRMLVYPAAIEPEPACDLCCVNEPRRLTKASTCSQ